MTDQIEGLENAGTRKSETKSQFWKMPTSIIVNILSLVHSLRSRKIYGEAVGRRWYRLKERW